MTHFLERLDAAASTVVPLLYLAGLALGTLSYFTGVVASFNLAVGSALAFAAELHSFLQLRRTRASYGVLSRLAEGDERRDLARRALRVNVAILAVLVAFSAYNATSFAASTWRPVGGFLPIWIQVAIRGLIVPVLFLLAGFLSPLSQDAGALLADASRTMLHKTLRTTLRQWRQRVDRAARRGRDLAPIAVALMRDAGDEEGARRVALIADGLAAAEGAALSVDAVDVEESPRTALPAPPAAAPTPPSWPPTGPGSPAAAEGSNLPGTHGEPALQLVDPSRRRRTISAERRVRRVLQAHPDISAKSLAKVARVSDSTASKYVRLWRQEHGALPGVDGDALAR